MGAQAQKRRLMLGMKIPQARKRFKEIWHERHPDEKFETVHGHGIWTWMDIWLHLRAVSGTFDDVCQAFGEKISKANKHNHELEQKISLQKKELAKNHGYILHLQKELRKYGASPESLKQEPPQGENPQAAERKDEAVSKTDRQTQVKASHV